MDSFILRKLLSLCFQMQNNENTIICKESHDKSRQRTRNQATSLTRKFRFFRKSDNQKGRSIRDIYCYVV